MNLLVLAMVLSLRIVQELLIGLTSATASETVAVIRGKIQTAKNTTVIR